MRKRMTIAALLLVVLVPVNAFQELPKLAASRGCCMERRQLNSNDWRPNGMSFGQCRDVNRQQDRNDDLYRPSGYFWWNLNC